MKKILLLITITSFTCFCQIPIKGLSTSTSVFATDTCIVKKGAVIYKSTINNAFPVTGVTPGSYTNANLTIDSKGRVTFASTGSSSKVSKMITRTLSSTGSVTLSLDTNFKSNITQTGNLTFTAGTLIAESNARISVIGASGSTYTLAMPSGWINGNGNTFDPTKKNIYDIKYTGSEVIYYITKIPLADAVAPFISSATTNSSGNTITLTYSEPIVGSPSYTLSPSRTISSYSISASSVTLSLSAPYANTDVITISGGSGLTDIAGNAATLMTSYSVTNAVTSFSNVTWVSLQNATNTGGGVITTTGSGPSGGQSSVSINCTIPFEIVSEVTSANSATIVYLDDENSSNYAWGGPNTYLSGFFYVGTTIYHTTTGGSQTTLAAPYSIPYLIKTRKSGNDIIYSISTNSGASFSDIYTVTGALSGLSTIYLKAMFAAPSSAQNIKVYYTN